MRKLLAGSLAVCVVLLVAAPPAPATTTIRGQVKGAKGFTLNGTAASGRTVAQRLGAPGRFTLRFKGSAGRGATLHLIRSQWPLLRSGRAGAQGEGGVPRPVGAVGEARADPAAPVVCNPA